MGSLTIERIETVEKDDIDQEVAQAHSTCVDECGMHEVVGKQIRRIEGNQVVEPTRGPEQDKGCRHTSHKRRHLFSSHSRGLLVRGKEIKKRKADVEYGQRMCRLHQITVCGKKKKNIYIYIYNNVNGITLLYIRLREFKMKKKDTIKIVRKKKMKKKNKTKNKTKPK